jgi:hypothetical protein
MRENRSPHRQLAVAALREVVVAVESFQFESSFAERSWSVALKAGGGWRQLGVTEYGGTYYVSLGRDLQCAYRREQDHVEGTLRIKDMFLLTEVRKALGEIHRKVAQDPIAYHRELLRTIPPTMRFGTISRQFCKILLPEWNRFDRELSPEEGRACISLLERDLPKISLGMTANTYFEYCRIAYLANPSTHENGAFDRSLSGRELYSRFADGRDGGLLAIPPDSAEAFREWYQAGRMSGGHPWEIYRGGNSTHIDLGVASESSAKDSEFSVYLCADSSSRLVETCRIALALHGAGLPFQWLNRESYLDRLRGEDNVGIIPSDCPLSYGSRRFPRELRVVDCIHYDMFLDYNTGKPLASWAAIKGIVSWLPIRPLMTASR